MTALTTAGRPPHTMSGPRKHPRVTFRSFGRLSRQTQAFLLATICEQLCPTLDLGRRSLDTYCAVDSDLQFGMTPDDYSSLPHSAGT